ncbi:hypothetical protein Syun_016726 [Stephania yunnanensis]|uniref:Uncharacterized protein n=1 Tax=Stephania yunnanensis TaxID=152371 RepID=A0AAP0P2Q1_9MAGN
MNVPAIHGGLLKPDVVEGTDDERVWSLPCWDLTETSKRDDGIDLLKDNQALQRLTGTAEKAKMDLSSLTQTNIRMVEVIWNTWSVHLMEHTTKLLVDEMMSLGSNLMDVNVAFIKLTIKPNLLHSPHAQPTLSLSHAQPSPSPTQDNPLPLRTTLSLSLSLSHAAQPSRTTLSLSLSHSPHNPLPLLSLPPPPSLSQITSSLSPPSPPAHAAAITSRSRRRSSISPAPAVTSSLSAHSPAAIVAAPHRANVHRRLAPHRFAIALTPKPQPNRPNRANRGSVWLRFWWFAIWSRFGEPNAEVDRTVVMNLLHPLPRVIVWLVEGNCCGREEDVAKIGREGGQNWPRERGEGEDSGWSALLHARERRKMVIGGVVSEGNKDNNEDEGDGVGKRREIWSSATAVTMAMMRGSHDDSGWLVTVGAITAASTMMATVATVDGGEGWRKK